MSTPALRFTLLGDGTSDAALLPIVTWLLREHLPAAPIERGQLADLRRLPDHLRPSLDDLTGRMRTAVEFYACDVLFFHRDAEKLEEYGTRRKRIRAAAEVAHLDVPVIPVVPVRMTEAWLVHDIDAIRRAAGRPAGTEPLDLPSPKHVEKAHAKDRLFHALRTAANLSGRRARKFSETDVRARLAELIDDFDPLRRFSAFQDLERDVSAFCSEWSAPQGQE